MRDLKSRDAYINTQRSPHRREWAWDSDLDSNDNSPSDDEETDSFFMSLMNDDTVRYEFMFPLNVIESGMLLVGEVMERANGALGNDGRSVNKLLFQGKQLKDYNTPCIAYNVKNQSKLVCIFKGRAQREAATG